MSKVIVLILVFILLCGLSGYFMITNICLRKSITELESNRQKELNRQLSHEKESIKRKLIERYRDFVTSYEDMARKLEEEKRKAKELEEKTSSGSGLSK